MVGTIERIAQEIAALDKATSAIADELYSAYSAYLAVLAQAVRQQLILASYHVCTQGYPEAFLRLPYSHRQQLQQRLRHLGVQVQEEILAQLHVPVLLDDPDLDPVFVDPALEDPALEDPALEDPALAALASRDLASGDLVLGTADLTSDTPAQADPALLDSTPAFDVSTSTQPRSLTPTHLAHWREELEHAIVAELKATSHATNRLLQQAHILPQTLPESVLEAATKAEIAEATSTPNLLNLLVEAANHTAEADAAADSNGNALVHIIAIYLRLPEIEFADPSVAAARSKIRSLFARLKTLGRDYQKKQHEQSIAEAQAAWRSSWIEE
ncbi:MAG: hypothetical protein KME27_09900 [Lyngbya sp. HA4199-MV5]|jgi:hypothetical protein|nr:hypothetical protein [Lyngbya sp. HA4199-MV5]